MSKRTFFVTGSMGCIGAWTLYHLVRRGDKVISFDISDKRDRLNLLLTPAEQEPIEFVAGDLTNSQQVTEVIESRQVTDIIHLAALQVPFCKANPVLGAQVNVVGTVNIFEAAKKRGLSNVVYASSIAVYGPADVYPAGLIQHDAPHDPRTLYGVYKQANEGTARVYWQDHHISSTSLRPYIVYGVGRDQGMTSEPTKAMLAATAGQPYHIAFGGTAQYQLASDVARQFIEVGDMPLEGANAFNLGGKPASMDEVVNAIKAAAPGVEITYDPQELPFPVGFDDSELCRRASQVWQTPLVKGIRQTIEHFRQCLDDGRLSYPA